MLSCLRLRPCCWPLSLLLLLLLLSGAVLTKTSNLTPFAPFGFNGIFKGASMVFFAYLVRGAPSTPTQHSTCGAPGNLSVSFVTLVQAQHPQAILNPAATPEPCLSCPSCLPCLPPPPLLDPHAGL